MKEQEINCKQCNAPYTETYGYGEFCSTLCKRSYGECHADKYADMEEELLRLREFVKEIASIAHTTFSWGNIADVEHYVKLMVLINKKAQQLQSKEEVCECGKSRKACGSFHACGKTIKENI